MKRYLYIIGALLLSATALQAQELRFAWLADTHISMKGQAAEDLKLCIRDMNENTRPDFVICAGDITNFGSDEELAFAKELLDALEMPYYAVAGNHDATWSESGCNSVVKTFGYEQFDFSAGGWRFLGCTSGPNMRMAPALTPRSDLVWLGRLEKKEGQKGCIFINHYPMDSSVLNYFDVRKELRRNDVRICLGGHWHRNTVLDYGGIPGILGRSSLSNAKQPAGYNIVTIKDGVLEVRERRVFPSSAVTLGPWYSRELLPLEEQDAGEDEFGLPADYPWMRYDVNAQYPRVKEAWRLTEDSDIASGMASDGGKRIFYACCDGTLRAVSTEGRRLWSAKLPGKIFSTPAFADGIVMVGCADNGLYAFKASNGRLLWKIECGKSVLASPAVHKGRVYFGASDGIFRAADIRSGKLCWTFGGVGAFVEDKAFVDDRQVVFGAWDKTLYSLSTESGELMWKWQVKRNSDMYSPASCWPLKSAGRIFVAVPDRRTYVLDAESGEELYFVEGGRESLGISPDFKYIYVKTMHSEAYALKADGRNADDALLWRKRTCLGYDISPTALECDGRMVFVPSDKGNLIALDAADGSLIWAHKISIALVNPMLLSCDRKGGRHIFASTMDGVVVRLDY